MKKLYLIIPALLLLIFGCSGSDNPSRDEDPVTELNLRQDATGQIASVGDVDWYHYRVTEANTVMEISCRSNTYRADVDLLVSVYEENASGEKIRLYADHAMEDSQLPADIKLYIYIDTPKDIYIAVRDLKDDECSDNNYYLKIDFTTSDQGNENFSQAVSITVDDEQSCQVDAINSIGDVDCFTFTADTDGIYEVKVDYTPYQGGTEVKLTLDLYDSDGVLIDNLATGRDNQYYMRLSLLAGDYYVLVDENGRNDFDNSSTYQICINSIDTDENRQNDTAGTATLVSTGSPMEISGSLDYSGDQDWYRFSTTGSGLKVLNLTFTVANINFKYQINVEDADNNLLLTHDQSGGITVYATQIRAGEGDYHYLMIEAADGQTITQPASYEVSLDVLTITDPNDAANLGNSPDTAVELIAGAAAVSDTYIGFRGDVDWYKISVPAVDPIQAQVLEIDLQNSAASDVEYYLSILYGSSIVKKVFDSNGEDGATHLKMSILVPKSDQDLTYFFKVCDYQGDDGDSAIAYEIKADIKQFITALPTDGYGDLADTQYYAEPNELDETSTITLQHSSIQETEYKVNSSLLDFHQDTLPDWITTTTDGEGLTTITFPWIGGYIDYQRDMDFFEVDLGPYVATDTNWYYEIKMELHVGDGSEVEYSWEFYRDSNQDQVLVDRPSSASCIFAGNGDTTPEDVAGIDLSDGFDEFWVGDVWAADSPKFYISMSDFNFVDNAPDDDWGGNLPYYFKLTLIYHPGESRPAN